MIFLEMLGDFIYFFKRLSQDKGRESGNIRRIDSIFIFTIGWFISDLRTEL